MNGISQLSSVPPVCLHSGKKKDMLRTFGIVFVIDSNLIDCNVIQSDRRCVFQDGHLLRSSNDFKTVEYLKRFASNTSHDLSQACDRLTCRAGKLNGSKYGSSQTVPSHCGELGSKVDSNKLHVSHLYPGIESPTIDDKLNDKVISEILARNSRSIIDVNMNAHLAGCVSKTLINSPRFLQGFQKYIVSPEAGGRYRAVDQTLKRHADLPVRNGRDISKRSIFRLIQIRLIYPNYHWLDLAWYFRLEELIIKRALLDDALNWLSTLGGAYSALGDYCNIHAENAARISLQQLKVALEMGSPPIIVRCHLYLGLSLMQRGRLRIAKRIIRDQYNKAKSMSVIDTHLLSMCLGLWSRLRYLYSLRHRNNSTRSPLQSTTSVGTVVPLAMRP